ncbi:terminase, partial [Salmonella enterica]|nr:terminase [Salmonella enterica]
GRVMVETKKDLAKRDIPSPNVADAFIMAFAPTDSALDNWATLGCK